MLDKTISVSKTQSNNLAHELDLLSRQIYNLTVQYGQACLLDDKTKASSYWQMIIEGYNEMDLVINRVHKLQYKIDETADILAEIGESQ